MIMTDKKEFRRVIVEGIAMYASVHTPRKAYTEGEPDQYQLDLIVDDENAELLTREGLKPANKKVNDMTKIPKEYPGFEGMKVFSLKRKTLKKDKTPMGPLSVTDADTNPIPPSILIGNGSKVRVSLNPYTVRGLTGAVLLGVQVIELVEFIQTPRDNGLIKTQGFTVQCVNAIEDSKFNTVDDDQPPF
jgi:hypothetical protein